MKDIKLWIVDEKKHKRMQGDCVTHVIQFELENYNGLNKRDEYR